jgi:transcription termination factor Rho
MSPNEMMEFLIEKNRKYKNNRDFLEAMKS